MPYTIAEIRDHNVSVGRCFFETDTMRYWRSRIYPYVYEGPGGVFFVTRERNCNDTGYDFHIRRYDPETEEIDTALDSAFYEKDDADNLKDARTAAKECAAGTLDWRSRYKREYDEKVAAEEARIRDKQGFYGALNEVFADVIIPPSYEP